MPDLDQGLVDEIRRTKQNTLDAALRSDNANRFGVVQEQQRIDEEKRVRAKEETPALERILESGEAGVGQTAAAEVFESISGVSERFGYGIKAKDINDPYEDPDWDLHEHKEQREEVLKAISDRGIDPESSEAASLGSSSSRLEFNERLEDIDLKREQLQNVQDNGFLTGVVPFMIPQFLDLDVFVGGGIYSKLNAASKLRTIQKVSRLKNIGSGITAGVSSALLVEGTRAGLDPAIDSRDLIGIAALSAILGGGIGGVLPVKRSADILDTVNNARYYNDLKEAVDNTASRQAQKTTAKPVQDDLGEKGPDIPEDAEATVAPLLAPSNQSQMRIVLDESRSVGSAGITDLDTPVIDISQKSKELIDLVENELDDVYADGIRDFADFVEDHRPAPVQFLQKNAERLYKGFNKLNMLPDYDKAMMTGNAPLQWLSIKLMSSPLGQIANSRSADNIAETLETQVRAKYAPFQSARYQGWANRKGYNFKERNVYTGAHAEFGKEIQNYLAHKLKGETIKADPDVVKAADDIQGSYKHLLDLHKKHGTEGFEDVDWKDGHFKVVWQKDKWLQIEHMRGVGTQNIVKALQQGIMKASPEMDEKTAFIVASAIKRHAQAPQGASPVGSLMTMSEDGRTAIEDVLREAGVDEADILMRTDAILYKDAEQGTVKAARRRIAIDYTTRIPGTDKTLLDLIDNDVYGALDSASRGQTAEIGRVSATDGLIQKRDIPAWRLAIEDYARQNNQDPIKASKIADDIFSMFSEGAYSGGVSANVNRLNRAGRQSYLSQLGITQIAETGIMMSKSNIKAFSKVLGRSVQDTIRGLDNDLVDALSASGKYLRPDELQGTVLNLDEVSFGDASLLGRIVDTTLDRGQKLMGNVSGFYHVTGAQQRMSMEINNNFLFNGIAKGSISKRRLASMGVDEQAFGIAKKYNKVITRDADGHVTDLNIHNWTPEDLDLWRGVIKQNVDYDVQKTRRGFGHALIQRSDLASVMASLKTFAMNAMFSKALRGARMADRQAAAEMVYNLAWASIAVTASAAVNGKLDDLDLDRLASRTLNWSAHVSPILMLSDPIGYMLGVDYIGNNGSSPIQRYRYAQDGLLSMPAPLSAAGQALGVFRTPADLLDDGKLDRRTINSLKAVPVVGRMYGVPWLLEEYYEGLRDKD